MSKDYIFEPRPVFSSHTPNLFLGSYYIEDDFQADPSMWADPLEDAFVTNSGMKEGKNEGGPEYLNDFAAETVLIGTDELDSLEVIPQAYFWKWDNYDSHLQIPTEISEDNFEFSAYERFLECAAGYDSDDDPYFLLVVDSFMDEGEDVDIWAEEADWTRIQTTKRWWDIYDLWMDHEGIEFLLDKASDDHDWAMKNSGDLQMIGYEIPEPDDDDYYWSMRQAENEGHWMTFGRVDYNWATDPDDVELTDEEFSIIDEHIRNEIRYEIDTDNLPGESDISSWTLSLTPDEGEPYSIYYYWGPAQTTGVNSAEGIEAEVCPCGCAMEGCVCSSSCKGECLGAESISLEYSPQYQHELWRKGDMRIVADYDEDFWNINMEGWFEDDEEYEQFKERVNKYGVYRLTLEKENQGNWEWVDSLGGTVPNENLKLMDIAREQFEFNEAESFSAEMGDFVKDNEWIVFGTKKTGGTTQGNQGIMLGRSPSLKGAKKMMDNFGKKGYGNRYATIGKRLKRQKALLGGLLEAEGSTDMRIPLEVLAGRRAVLGFAGLDDICWRCAEYGDKISSHCKNCGVCEECECAVDCESRETLGSETVMIAGKKNDKMYSVAHIQGLQDKEGFTPEAIIGGNEELDNPLYAKIVEDGAKKGLYENHAESFSAEMLGNPVRKYEKTALHIHNFDAFKRQSDLLSEETKRLYRLIDTSKSVAESEAIRRAITEVYNAIDILHGGYWDYGAESYDHVAAWLKENNLEPSDIEGFTPDGEVILKPFSQRANYKGIKITDKRAESFSAQSDGVKRVCQRNITQHCKNYSLGWVNCPGCGQPYTDEDVVTDETDYKKFAESFADENCRENHLMCDDCKGVCLDCHPEADAGGDICKFCSGESIERYDAETFEAEYIHIYDTTITEPEILKKLEGAGIKPTDYYWLNEDTFGLHINSSDADAFQEEFNKKDWTGLYAFDAHWGVRFKRAETFEAPYTGAGSLMGITGDTDLSSFTSKELTESSAIHGDFDTASLDYSGHQNIEVRAETITIPGSPGFTLWEDMTPEERRARMESTRANARAWQRSPEGKLDGAFEDNEIIDENGDVVYDEDLMNAVFQVVKDHYTPKDAAAIFAKNKAAESDKYGGIYAEGRPCPICGLNNMAENACGTPGNDMCNDCCPKFGGCGHCPAETLLSPQEALEVCEAGGAVYLKDYTDQPDDYDSFDYPIEDPEDIRMYIEEGLFDGPNAVTILSEPRPMEASERF